jgi:hypothetical protein
MPCDCPEERPRPALSGGCNYLVYSGGPLSSFYRLVEQAIPADAVLSHGRPTVHPDGSLEFTGPPPPFAGYRREGSRLCPAWPPCALRMLRVQVVDGLLSVDGVCGSPEAGQFTRAVAPGECQDCPVRRS